MNVTISIDYDIVISFHRSCTLHIPSRRNANDLFLDRDWIDDDHDIIFNSK